MQPSDVRPVSDTTPAHWLATALAGHGRSGEVGAVVPAGYPAYVEVVLSDEEAFWRVRDLLATRTTADAPCWFAIWEGWPLPLTWQSSPTFATPEGDLYLLAGRFADAEVVAVELVCAGMEQGTQVTHSPPLSPEMRALAARTMRADRVHLPPSLWWPDDRSWVLGRQVDSDALLLAGSEDLAGDVLATPGLDGRRTDPDEPFRVEE